MAHRETKLRNGKVDNQPAAGCPNAPGAKKEISEEENKAGNAWLSFFFEFGDSQAEAKHLVEEVKLAMRGITRTLIYHTIINGTLVRCPRQTRYLSAIDCIAKHPDMRVSFAPSHHDVLERKRAYESSIKEENVVKQQPRFLSWYS